MRIVLDTNIFIAAALKSGLAEDIIKIAVTSDLITLITSEDILLELKEKLTSKFGWGIKQTNFYIEKVREVFEIIVVKEKLEVISRDPDDNKILECAIFGKADLIVSTDQDLIKLKVFKGIAVIHPKTLSWTLPEYFKKT